MNGADTIRNALKARDTEHSRIAHDATISQMHLERFMDGAIDLEPKHLERITDYLWAGTLIYDAEKDVVRNRAPEAICICTAMPDRIKASKKSGFDAFAPPPNVTVSDDGTAGMKRLLTDSFPGNTLR